MIGSLSVAAKWGKAASIQNGQRATGNGHRATYNNGQERQNQATRQPFREDALWTKTNRLRIRMKPRPPHRDAGRFRLGLLLLLLLAIFGKLLVAEPK